ncbi:MAG: PQQ-binding-like beta-propeller repeat protein [Planctomycetota bacterium]
MIALTLSLLTLPVLAQDTLEERLWEAAKIGDVDAIEALLEEGADVNARTEFEATALYFAASNDHAEACAFLADAGAELDVADSFYDNTPIGMAGWLGHADCVVVLIDKGSSGGIGAMFAAASNGHVDVVRAVLETMEVPQGVKDSACANARAAGAENVVAVLVEAGAAEPPARAEAEAAEETRESAATKIDDPYVPVADPSPWPGFRGPGGTGLADGQRPPLTWDLESDHHIRWRAPVAGLGHSSPVVWGNRVFVTTAVGERPHTGIEEGDRGWIGSADESFNHRFLVQCFRLDDGELLWSTECHEGVPLSERHWKASHANSTAAVSAERVVVSFGSHGVHCLDHDGKILWSKDLGLLDAGWFVDDSFGWGYASSPVIWDDRVILQCDVKGGGYAAALSLEDGEELWRVGRDELPSWGTPCVYATDDGPQVAMNASNAICGYDPENGELVWEIRGNSKITVASPVAGEGLVVATGGYQRPAPVYVIRAGAFGDLTPGEGENGGDPEGVVWSNQRDGVYQPTPLIYDGLLYMLRSNGVLSCFVAETGERLYRERVGGGMSAFTASPIAADGYLYLTGEAGDVSVVRAGPDFEIVAVNDIGGSTLATPAISNGVFLLRTLDELVAVAHR